MQILSLFFASLAVLLTATASPITQHQYHRRAGAPIPKSIPQNCTITNPIAALEYASNTTGSSPAPRYRPTNETTASQLYAYYLQPDSFQVTSSNSSALFTQCLDTCYGYGNPGECVAAYQAYNVPAPPMFGAPGGNPTVACLMYSRPLSPGDFESVPKTLSGWGNTTAGDISCPAS